jgi:hypothetical protein
MKYLYLLIFCTYAHLLCSVFFGQRGEEKGTTTQVLEWGGLLFALGVAFAVSAGEYLSLSPAPPCVESLVFSEARLCDGAEVMHATRVFLLELLPRMLAVFAGQYVLAVAVRRLSSAHPMES